MAEHRPYEECPEVTENEILKKAGQLHLEYKCKINELVKDFTNSQCVELMHTCELAKGNNCPAHMFYAVGELKDALLNLMQWHRFNHYVHGIELK